MKPETCRANADQILTWSGVVMDPFDPLPEQVRIEDIAHALSLMVRANGHICHFYSVAQHCLNCAFEALARGEKDDIALLCLLHDASECYLSDVTRPVKRRLTDYRNAEKRLSDVVYASLAGYLPTQAQLQKVADIDDCLLHHEFKELRGVSLQGLKPAPLAVCDMDFCNPEIVKKRFLQSYHKFSGR